MPQNTPMTSQQILTFTKYIRRHELARLLVQYELFKMSQTVKGSIVECGVYLGSGVLAWGKLAECLEPYNFLRKIVGFDTFEGFPSIANEDLGGNASAAKIGHLDPKYDTFAEIQECIADFNSTRLLSHQDKIILVKGDATRTIPEYLSTNPHLLVSLLYLDFDIYEPTKIALQHFLPRMPKGAIVAFDELNDPKWPGETAALLEILDLRDYSLQSFPFEPHISYIQL